jgi:hypothetical protein
MEVSLNPNRRRRNMAVILEAAAQNAACNAIVDLVDAGSGAGTLVFYLANGSTEVATCTFSDPAFGNAAAGVATASAITPDSDATGNAAAATIAKFLDSDATVVLSCAVSTIAAGTGDIQLSNNVITAGETVDVTALTVTVPASPA